MRVFRKPTKNDPTEFFKFFIMTTNPGYTHKAPGNQSPNAHKDDMKACE